MMESRTTNVTRNISMAMFAKFIEQIVGFIVRTVFIKTLSIEYLGLNGLFNNILSFLSLAELGIGSAIIYLMYDPIAKDNLSMIRSYMSAYKKLYAIIGIALFGIGISLTPFLSFFIKDRSNIKVNVELIYILYIIQTLSTYFFAYKQSIFTAHQKGYIINGNTILFSFLRSVLSIVFLLISKSFVIYLIVNLVINYIQNIRIGLLANKHYPYITEKVNTRLTKKQINEIKRNIGAMFLHKVGAVVLNSSDNLILSRFIGLISVGIYSNYSTILLMIRTVLWTIFDAIVPSVGNLCTQNNDEHKYVVFEGIQLLNLWLSGFCAICLGVLINPFIILWIGEEYLLSQVTVWTIILSYYIQTNVRAIEMFRSATGLFYNDRYVPLMQCIINVVVSIIMVKFWGIAGIFIGTTISILLTTFWVQPWMVYKYIFKKPLSSYFYNYSKSLMVTVLSLIITYNISGLLGKGLLDFILKLICCLIMPNIVYLVVYFRTKEFNYLLDKGMTIIKRRG